MPDKITKFIQSLDKKTRRKLKNKLLELKKKTKTTQNIKKLSGKFKNHYRLRIGKIRIIFKFSKKNIKIIDIDWRGNIY